MTSIKSTGLGGDSVKAGVTGVVVPGRLTLGFGTQRSTGLGSNSGHVFLPFFF